MAGNIISGISKWSLLHVSSDYSSQSKGDMSVLHNCIIFFEVHKFQTHLRAALWAHILNVSMWFCHMKGNTSFLVGKVPLCRTTSVYWVAVMMEDPEGELHSPKNLLILSWDFKIALNSTHEPKLHTKGVPFLFFKYSCMQHITGEKWPNVLQGNKDGKLLKNGKLRVISCHFALLQRKMRANKLCFRSLLGLRQGWRTVVLSLAGKISC